MVAGPITSWQKHGETVKDFIFLGSKITAEIDWSHEIKRCLLLGRKAMTNLDSVLKSRDITLLTKVCIVKAIVFPVVMYGWESWTIKKAEHRRIDVFEMWCWRTFLRAPWTARSKPVNPTGNQPWMFIGRTDVKVPILWPPDVKSQLIGKDPNTGKGWGQEKGTIEDERVAWHHRLNGHEFEQISGDSEGCAAVHGISES